MLTIQEKIDVVYNLLDEFSSVNGENPIEYQNEAVPSVKRMCDWFISAGVLTQKDKVYCIKNNLEQFQFFNEENPVTLEYSEDFNFETMAIMIGTNDLDYRQFIRVFKLNTNERL